MENISDSCYYTLKDNVWLENQRHAWKILSNAVLEMSKHIHPGISTKKINDIGEEYIRSNNDCIPTFKGYRGFPEAVCISLNNEVVHGIPKDNVILKDGDIVKIDCGVTYNGAIADMARTYSIGNIDIKYKYLMDACKRALNDSIKYINDNIGKNVIRLGDVGNIIHKTAKRINANVITSLSGHGLENDTLHWYPFVNNVGERGKGLRLYPGMTIAIEPMVLYDDNSITVGNDNWTVFTKSIAIHEEDTIFIHNDHVEIITK